MTTVGIVGVGSIGGYVAAQLSHAGHDVVLCSRRPFDRLVVEGHRRLVVDQPAFTEPSTVAAVDWVVLTTKVNDNDSVTPWLTALCDGRTRALLVLQNGLGPSADLVRLVEPVPVIPAVVLCGAELLAPGHVRHHQTSILQIAAADSALVAPLFGGTDLTIESVADFAAAAWRKLVVNAVSNPIGALTGRRLDVFADERIAVLAQDLAAECIAVARAAGVDLTVTADEVVAMLQGAAPTMGSSMYYDRAAGRPTEIDALSGAVVRAGREHGVATPLNEAMLALVGALSVGHSDGLLPPATEIS